MALFFYLFIRNARCRCTRLFPVRFQLYAFFFVFLLSRSFPLPFYRWRARKLLPIDAMEQNQIKFTFTIVLNEIFFFTFFYYTTFFLSLSLTIRIIRSTSRSHIVFLKCLKFRIWIIITKEFFIHTFALHPNQNTGIKWVEKNISHAKFPIHISIWINSFSFIFYPHSIKNALAIIKITTTTTKSNEMLVWLMLLLCENEYKCKYLEIPIPHANIETLVCTDSISSMPVKMDRKYFEIEK